MFIDGQDATYDAVVMRYAVDELSTLKDFIDARFNALEARISQMYTQLDKEDSRQAVALDRLAEKMASAAALEKLGSEVKEIGKDLTVLERCVNQLKYRSKVTWYIGSLIITIVVALLVAAIKSWLGL